MEPVSCARLLTITAKRKRTIFCLNSIPGLTHRFTACALTDPSAGKTLRFFFSDSGSTGFKKFLVEIVDEGLTIGLVGMILLLALALPAFDETNKNWRDKEEYSVMFLDRYGKDIGRRGIRQTDSDEIDTLPDHFIKAVLATEDRRFFEHYGIDFLGLGRALAENVRANSVVQGGSSDHPAIGQEPVSDQ